MRWLIGLLAAGACAALGGWAARRLSLRVDTLNAWEGALSRMEGMAQHLAMGLPDMLRRASGGQIPCLDILADRIVSDPTRAPEELLRDLPWEPWLSGEERETARDCLLGLFAPTADQQLRAIRFAGEQWQHFRRISREQRERNGRLYRSLGWLGGAALFILMC